MIWRRLFLPLCEHVSAFVAPINKEVVKSRAFNDCHYTALPMDRYNLSAIQVANRQMLSGISVVHCNMSLYSAPSVTYVLIHLTHCQTVVSPYTHSKPLQIKAGFSTSKTKKRDHCSF